jgi:fatty aldehyde-generating acyl-ACP reductase
MSGDSNGVPVDFALLGHPASYEHMCDLFLHFRPDYSRDKLKNHKATVAKLFEWTPSYATKTPLTIMSDSRQQLSGRLIICTFLPEMIRSPRQIVNAYQKTLAGCRLGKELGAKIVGLGGFTSIVSGSQGETLAPEVGIAVTSGNSLTAALALAQLDCLVNRLGWDPSSRTVAVLGATGDIGRACALALAPRARRIILVARNEAKLFALRDELPVGPEVSVTTDVHFATQASVVVAATSATQPILAEADLAPGTLVCDIGYPKNLSYAPEPRSDLLVISGGLARMPFELGITYYTQLPAPTLMYGCFAEAIILALDGRYESFSVGQGRITPEKMDLILARALAHGFRPAPPYRGAHPVSDDALDLFAQRFHSAGEVRA